MWKLGKLKLLSKYPHICLKEYLLQVLYEKDVDRVLRSRSLGDIGDADAEDAIASADPAPPGGGDL